MTYRDLIFEGSPSGENEHSPPVLPNEYQHEYISCIPRIPLPNGRFIFYMRANASVVDRIVMDPRTNKDIIAYSWRELFYGNYRYWDWVFDADVAEMIESTPTRVRKKLAEVTDQEISGIYVPGIFSGDSIPDLQAPQFVVERYTRFRADTQLVTPAINAINDGMIKRLRASPQALFDLDPRAFEELICEILSRHGWRVELTPKSNDGGYDIFAISGSPGGVSSSWLVECKRYHPEHKVGVAVVRAICGVKEQIKAANAMIVTTSSFTRGAHKWRTSRLDLSLRDYQGVVEWLRNVP